MIETLAIRIAQSIKQANPSNTASVEVMSFSLIMVIGTGSSLLFSLLLSYLLGTLAETIIVLFSFMLLRAFSGGFHFKTAELCTITSVFGAVMIPHIPVNSTANIILTCFTIITLLAYAPMGMNQSKFFTAKHYPVLKVVSLCIVATNFFINSDLLSTTFFAQALTILVYRLKGGEVHEG